MAPDLAKWNMEAFGDGNPAGDPYWYQGNYSPYYNESHKKLRKELRAYVDEFIIPNVHDWDEAKEIPKEVRLEMGKLGFSYLGMGHPFPKEYAKVPEVLKGVEPDGFHEFIAIDELARSGSGGVVWGLAGGLTIGLPPVLRFGSEEMKKRICPPCLSGEKMICLCITEPTAGSDVANIKTVARKEGDFYYVTGQKKWITNGIWSDYFTVAVRTGAPDSGAKGLSFILVERSMPGVKTRRMDCSGVWCSGTTYVEFDNVKVPKENLIGKEGKGFKYMMYNFNHERLLICMQTNRFSRVCLEEAYKFATKRKTFGKALMEHPVIRWKLGEMTRMIEATHSWIEQLTYNMMKMEKLEADLKLGGQTALLKVQCTKVMEYCTREACQIFGGLSYSRGGQGEKVERLNREVRAMAIPGGSEEIMLELGVRQMKKLAEMSKQFVQKDEEEETGKGVVAKL